MITLNDQLISVYSASLSPTQLLLTEVASIDSLASALFHWGQGVKHLREGLPLTAQNDLM